MAESGRLRIGELSKRVGESPELLRAWETRYGLVAPERTPGGLRLYTDQDERRIRAMRHHINAGLSAAEAARLAKLNTSPAPRPSLPADPTEIELALQQSFDALDEPAAQAALDQLLSSFRLGDALGEVILPFLNRLGARWATTEVSVAQEHFASNVIGGRLRALARGWGRGVGPLAVLACMPGEQHDIGLLSFGLALRELGWRIAYLGADTPLSDLAEMLDELSPAVVVLAAVDRKRFLGNADGLTALAARARVAIAGAGADRELAERFGAEALLGGVVEMAAMLTPQRPRRAGGDHDQRDRR